MALNAIHWNLFLRLAMALLSGLLLFLSFPKFGNGILAWVALVPLFYAMRDAKPWEGFKIGFLTGLVAHVGILYWISYVVVQYGYLPVYAANAIMLLLAAYLSLYTAFFVMGIILLRNRGKALCISAPLLWTVLEFARSHCLTGFPWENISYSQYVYRNIIQIADITGIYGITFTIILINAVIYNTWEVRSRKGKYPVVEMVAACVLLVIVYGYGHLRTADLQKTMAGSPSFEVDLVQGNIDQNIKWDKRYQSETLEIYRTLSLHHHSVQKGLIVWPETAAPFYFEHDDQQRSVILDIVRISGRPLIFGSPYYEDKNGVVSFMNSAYLIRSDATIAGRYDKVHLVPYGEYVPLRKIFPYIDKLATGIGDFRPGEGFLPLVSDGCRFGVLICYEAIFPEAARYYKRQKTDLLVNITNDAWFGRTSAPYQHLSMTVFRAVENRLYLVRAANAGISAVVDPTGKIIDRTSLFKRTVLTCAVKFIDVETFYAEYGDIFVYLCVIVLVFYSCLKPRRSKHAGRNS